MAGFSGIKNTLLAEQVQEQLYDYITAHSMKPGDKLPNEFKLAEQFGVGRSTVREAVKLLVSRNVLETRRGSGTYVKDLIPADMDPLNLRSVQDKVALAMDLVDLRLILEPEIAAKNAQVATATMASPPGMWPRKLLQRFTSLREIPPALIRFPASTKKGIASRVKLPVPENILCIIIERLVPPSATKASADDPTSTKAIGTPKIRSITILINNTAVILFHPPHKSSDTWRCLC